MRSLCSWLLAGLAVARSCCLELPACPASWNREADKPALCFITAVERKRALCLSASVFFTNVSRWRVLEKTFMVSPSYWLRGNSVFYKSYWNKISLLEIAISKDPLCFSGFCFSTSYAVKLSGKLQKLKWKKREVMEVKGMELKLEKNLFSSLAVKMG